MAKIETSRPLPRGHGPFIDVETIERELAELWQTPSAFDARGAAVTLSRTSVLTLFVFVTGDTQAAEAREWISQLSTQHPSRVVLLIMPEGSESETEQDAQVSIQCHLEGGERFAPCWEQITITLNQTSLEALSSIIIPLALPDLPSFLWWYAAPPVRDRAFRRVCQAVDRVILDSVNFGQPLADFLALSAVLPELSRRETVLSDLNWSRLAPWQEMTARTFDLPQYQWALDALTDVQVTIGHTPEKPANPLQAILYLGWLSNHLNWQLTEASGTEDHWTLEVRGPDDRPIHWELLCTRCEQAMSGHLLTVQFRAQQRGEQIRFAITRSEERQTMVKLHLTDHRQQEMHYAFHHAHLDPQRLLLRELQSFSPDPLYAEAVHEAEQFARALQRWLS